MAKEPGISGSIDGKLPEGFPLLGQNRPKSPHLTRPHVARMKCRGQDRLVFAVEEWRLAGESDCVLVLNPARTSTKFGVCCVLSGEEQAERMGA